MKKILVVSQNEALEEGVVPLLKFFEDFDIQHLIFRPNSFLEKILEDPPDIVFVDVGYNYLDGFYIGREIRKVNPEVKVVYISDSVRFATEAFEENASDYLVCPVTRERLEVTMSRIS